MFPASINVGHFKRRYQIYSETALKPGFFKHAVSVPRTEIKRYRHNGKML